MGPVRVWHQHFIAHAHCCGQSRHDRTRTAQRNGRILWADSITIDTLNLGGYQFSQPGPAAGRAISDRFAVDGFDGCPANMLRCAKTWLSYLQAHCWRQYFSASLRLSLQPLSVEAQGGDVVD